MLYKPAVPLIGCFYRCEKEHAYCLKLRTILLQRHQHPIENVYLCGSRLKGVENRLRSQAGVTLKCEPHDDQVRLKPACSASVLKFYIKQVDVLIYLSNEQQRR